MNIFYRILWKIQRNLDREKLMLQKSRFKYCGSNVGIEPSCIIIVPDRFSIGDNSSISYGTIVFASYDVTIGKNCLISSNCGISSYNHTINSENRRIDDLVSDQIFSRPVFIGDNVWIGMNSCIMPGVAIGNNSIVGSGSVVTKNIPENQIWAGNPAKFLKKLDL